MSYLSLEFVGFLSGAALIYRLAPKALRELLLLILSLAFYYWWSPVQMFLVVAVSLVAFAAVRLATKTTVANWSWIGSVVALLVCYLAFFKAIPLLQSLPSISQQPGILSRLPIVPIGISYYVFKLISYVLDSTRNRPLSEVRAIPFLNSIVFFPQALAGPIQRPKDFLEQSDRRPLITDDLWVSALRRILLGYFKKLVVADNLAAVVEYVYHGLHGTQPVPVWLAFYLYPFQLYMDFSALTDIAIGAGRLFGIEGPENFAAPFRAATISEYWRRWHMSLTRWLADYLFTPLRMATRNLGTFGLVFSVFVNMIIIGIWHGLTLPFLVFGVIHGAYLVGDVVSASYRKQLYRRFARLDRVMSLAAPLLVYHLVAFASVFFRAPTLADALRLIELLFDPRSYLNTGLLALVSTVGKSAIAAGLIGSLLIESYDAVKSKFGKLATLPAWPRPVRWAAYYGGIFAIAGLRTPVEQFIYFRF